ncbi:hypothetical protein HPB48_000658 [Haemaphysalis longicornis]|uniref:Uncharacterized protein n=1 Tax=Haemaphysalis longicornis TaxID=44386 RepID=A0A9J6G8M2_HAELO|nr:hypothetical protein HPB48_000658 [Haemaphysalis longicornis]
MADEAAFPRPKRSRQALEVAHDSPHGFFLIDECNPVPENQCCSAGEEEKSRSCAHPPSDQGCFPTPARSASCTYTTANDGCTNSHNPESSKSLHFDNDCSVGVLHVMKDLLPKWQDTKVKRDGEKQVSSSTIKPFDNPRVTFGGWGDKRSSGVITAFPMYKARALHKLSKSRNANHSVPILTEQRMKRRSPHRPGSPFRLPLFRESKGRKKARCHIRFVLPGDYGAQLSKENVAAKSSPRISRQGRMSRSRRQCSPLPGGRQWDVAVELPSMDDLCDVVDNLVKEFEQRPILKPSPPRTPRSLSVSRVSPGRLRRKSVTRSLSSPLYGYKKRRRQLPHGRRSALRLRGNVSVAFHSTSESRSSSGGGKELEGISRVCSLLESITGHVKTEAQQLCMPEFPSPAFPEVGDAGGSREYLWHKTKTRELPVKPSSSRRRRYMRHPLARKEPRKERSQRDDSFQDPSMNGHHQRQLTERNLGGESYSAGTEMERSQRDDSFQDPSMNGHHQRQLTERNLGGESYSAGTEMDATTSTSDMAAQSSTDAEHSLQAKKNFARYTKAPKRKKFNVVTNLVLRDRKSAGDDRLRKLEHKEVKNNTRRFPETADAPSSSSSSGSSYYVPRERMSGRTQGRTGKVEQPAEIVQVKSFGNSSQGKKYIQNSRKLPYKKEEGKHSTDPDQRSSTESSLRPRDYLEEVALRQSRSTLDDSTSQRSYSMQKPHQLDKRHRPSLEEPVAQNLPLYRARIARRPLGRLAEDWVICSNENSSSTGPLAQPASRPCTLEDTAGSSQGLTDTLSSAPLPKRPSRSVSIGIGLPQEWSTGPYEVSAPVSISAVVHNRPRRKFGPKSRQREPIIAKPSGSSWRFPEISPIMLPVSPVPVSDSHLIGQYAAMQARAPSEPLSLLASCNRMQSTPPIYIKTRHDRPGEHKLSATRLSIAMSGKQHSAYKGSGTTKLQSELPQPKLFSSTRVAPSRVNSTSCSAFFVTALDSVGTGPNFDRSTAETPPAQFMAPTMASTIGSLALVQPRDPSILPQSRQSQSNRPNPPRVPAFVEDESSYTMQSGEMTQSSTVSDTEARSSYNKYDPMWRSSSLDRWDQESTPPRDNSTDAIMSRGLPQLNVGYMKNFMRSGSTVLYIILVAGALAGIIAGFSLHMNSSASLDVTQDVGEADNLALSPMYSPLFERKFGLAYKPHSCHNPLCSEQVARLVRSLNSSVSPCRNFYGHVCSLREANNTADDPLVQQSESKVVAFFKGIGSPERDLPVAAASTRLWKDCVDLTMLSRLGRAPLQALLKLNGLSEWPYVAGNSGAAALPDVWETAGKLLRRMALSPLVGVSVTNRDTVQLIRGDVHSGSGEADDVLDAMLMLRRNSSRLREVAADVAALGRQLSGLLDLQPLPASPEDAKDLVTFLETAVKDLGFIHAGFVHTQPPSFLGPLLELLHRTEPQTVLNLLGYRLVRHVDLFTPSAVKADLLRRESQCAHTVLEAALTSDEAEYVRYAALRNQLDFDLVRSMVEQLKHALVAKLPGLRWFDANTLRETQRRLRKLKALYVRLSVVDTRDPDSPLWPVLQVARMGPRVSRCFLDLLVPPSEHGVRRPQMVNWSSAAHSRLDKLRTCLRSQKTPDNPAGQPKGPSRDELALADLGALGPSKDVFDTYVTRFAAMTTDSKATESEDNKTLSWDKVRSNRVLFSLLRGPWKQANVMSVF